MSEDATTFEEAKRCPKCNLPGEDRGTKRAGRRGVVVHTIFCRTATCPWFNTSWLVQVNEDGTIPKAYEQIGPKSFPKLSPESETRINESLKAQLAAETRGDGEIKNPRSR